ncbi:MAG: hypothetical protein LBB13_00300, partial [Rickettsiales bacterium]|nr:hypothetical protein [Rickettsiales bacterium]
MGDKKNKNIILNKTNQSNPGTNKPQSNPVTRKQPSNSQAAQGVKRINPPPIGQQNVVTAAARTPAPSSFVRRQPQARNFGTPATRSPAAAAVNINKDKPNVVAKDNSNTSTNNYYEIEEEKEGTKVITIRDTDTVLEMIKNETIKEVGSYNSLFKTPIFRWWKTTYNQDSSTLKEINNVLEEIFSVLNSNPSVLINDQFLSDVINSLQGGENLGEPESQARQEIISFTKFVQKVSSSAKLTLNEARAIIVETVLNEKNLYDVKRNDSFKSASDQIKLNGKIDVLDGITCLDKKDEKDRQMLEERSKGIDLKDLIKISIEQNVRLAEIKKDESKEKIYENAKNQKPYLTCNGKIIYALTENQRKIIDKNDRNIQKGDLDSTVKIDLNTGEGKSLLLKIIGETYGNKKSDKPKGKYEVLNYSDNGELVNFASNKDVMDGVKFLDINLVELHDVENKEEAIEKLNELFSEKLGLQTGGKIFSKNNNNKLNFDAQKVEGLKSIILSVDEFDSLPPPAFEAVNEAIALIKKSKCKCQLISVSATPNIQLMERECEQMINVAANKNDIKKHDNNHKTFEDSFSDKFKSKGKGEIKSLNEEKFVSMLEKDIDSNDKKTQLLLPDFSPQEIEGLMTDNDLRDICEKKGIELILYKDENGKTICYKKGTNSYNYSDNFVIDDEKQRNKKILTIYSKADCVGGDFGWVSHDTNNQIIYTVNHPSSSKAIQFFARNRHEGMPNLSAKTKIIMRTGDVALSAEAFIKKSNDLEKKEQAINSVNFSENVIRGQFLSKNDGEDAETLLENILDYTSKNGNLEDLDFSKNPELKKYLLLLESCKKSTEILAQDLPTGADSNEATVHNRELDVKRVELFKAEEAKKGIEQVKKMKLQIRSTANSKKIVEKEYQEKKSKIDKRINRIKEEITKLSKSENALSNHTAKDLNEMIVKLKIKEDFKNENVLSVTNEIEKKTEEVLASVKEQVKQSVEKNQYLFKKTIQSWATVYDNSSTEDNSIPKTAKTVVVVNDIISKAHELMLNANNGQNAGDYKKFINEALKSNILDIPIPPKTKKGGPATKSVGIAIKSGNNKVIDELASFLQLIDSIAKNNKITLAQAKALVLQNVFEQNLYTVKTTDAANLYGEELYSKNRGELNKKYFTEKFIRDGTDKCFLPDLYLKEKKDILQDMVLSSNSKELENIAENTDLEDIIKIQIRHNETAKTISKRIKGKGIENIKPTVTHDGVCLPALSENQRKIFEELDGSIKNGLKDADSIKIDLGTGEGKSFTLKMIQGSYFSRDYPVLKTKSDSNVFKKNTDKKLVFATVNLTSLYRGTNKKDAERILADMLNNEFKSQGSSAEFKLVGDEWNFSKGNSDNSKSSLDALIMAVDEYDQLPEAALDAVNKFKRKIDTTKEVTCQLIEISATPNIEYMQVKESIVPIEDKRQKFEQYVDKHTRNRKTFTDSVKSCNAFKAEVIDGEEIADSIVNLVGVDFTETCKKIQLLLPDMNPECLQSIVSTPYFQNIMTKKSVGRLLYNNNGNCVLCRYDSRTGSFTNSHPSEEELKKIEDDGNTLMIYSAADCVGGDFGKFSENPTKQIIYSYRTPNDSLEQQFTSRARRNDMARIGGNNNTECEYKHILAKNAGIENYLKKNKKEAENFDKNDLMALSEKEIKLKEIYDCAKRLEEEIRTEMLKNGVFEKNTENILDRIKSGNPTDNEKKDPLIKNYILQLQKLSELLGIGGLKSDEDFRPAIYNMQQKVMEEQKIGVNCRKKILEKLINSKDIPMGVEANLKNNLKAADMELHDIELEQTAALLREIGCYDDSLTDSLCELRGRYSGLNLEKFLTNFQKTFLTFLKTQLNDVRDGKYADENAKNDRIKNINEKAREYIVKLDEELKEVEKARSKGNESVEVMGKELAELGTKLNKKFEEEKSKLKATDGNNKEFLVRLEEDCREVLKKAEEEFRKLSEERQKNIDGKTLFLNNLSGVVVLGVTDENNKEERKKGTEELAEAYRGGQNQFFGIKSKVDNINKKLSGAESELRKSLGEKLDKTKKEVEKQLEINLSSLQSEYKNKEGRDAQAIAAQIISLKEELKGILGDKEVPSKILERKKEEFITGIIGKGFEELKGKITSDFNHVQISKSDKENISASADNEKTNTNAEPGSLAHIDVTITGNDDVCVSKFGGKEYKYLEDLVKLIALLEKQKTKEKEDKELKEKEKEKELTKIKLDALNEIAGNANVIIANYGGEKVAGYSIKSEEIVRNEKQKNDGEKKDPFMGKFANVIVEKALMDVKNGESAASIIISFSGEEDVKKEKGEALKSIEHLDKKLINISNLEKESEKYEEMTNQLLDSDLLENHKTNKEGVQLSIEKFKEENEMKRNKILNSLPNGNYETTITTILTDLTKLCEKHKEFFKELFKKEKSKIKIEIKNRNANNDEKIDESIKTLEEKLKKTYENIPGTKTLCEETDKHKIKIEDNYEKSLTEWLKKAKEAETINNLDKEKISEFLKCCKTDPCAGYSEEIEEISVSFDDECKKIKELNEEKKRVSKEIFSEFLKILPKNAPLCELEIDDKMNIITSKNLRNGESKKNSNMANFLCLFYERFLQLDKDGIGCGILEAETLEKLEVAKKQAMATIEEVTGYLETIAVAEEKSENLRNLISNSLEELKKNRCDGEKFKEFQKYCKESLKEIKNDVAIEEFLKKAQESSERFKRFKDQEEATKLLNFATKEKLKEIADLYEKKYDGNLFENLSKGIEEKKKQLLKKKSEGKINLREEEIQGEGEIRTIKCTKNDGCTLELRLSGKIAEKFDTNKFNKEYTGPNKTNGFFPNLLRYVNTIDPNSVKELDKMIIITGGMQYKSKNGPEYEKLKSLLYNFGAENEDGNPAARPIKDNDDRELLYKFCGD